MTKKVKTTVLERASPKSWIYTSTAILILCSLAYFKLYLNAWQNIGGLIATATFTVIASTYLIFYGIYFIKKYFTARHDYKVR